MSQVAIAIASVFGLLIGSFLNVVIYRVPIGISIVSPRSSCPNCKEQLHWYENVPVVSWLLLRGRCRNCGTKIRIRYLLVELLTGLIFGFSTFLHTQLKPDNWFEADQLFELVAFLIFFSCAIALAAIDLEHFRLPTSIILFGLAGMFIFLILASWTTWNWERLIIAAACSAGGFLLFLAIHLIAPHGMGLGDVRLAALIGLALGWLGVGPSIVGFFLGFALGAVFGVGLILFAKGNRKTQIPFGPWMIAGAWLSLLIGDFLWLWYLSLNGIFA